MEDKSKQDPNPENNDAKNSIERTLAEIEKYLIGVSRLKSESENEKNSKEETKKTSKEVLDNNEDNRNRANDHYQEYICINDEISQPLNQDALELEKSLLELKRLDDELGTKLSTALLSIKQVSSKLGTIVSAFSELDSAIKNSCEQQNLTKLKAIDFVSKVNHESERADTICQAANKNSADAVKTSGIKALINTQGFITAGTKVKTATAEFKADTDENITFSTEILNTNQTEFNNSLIALETAKNDIKIAQQADVALLGLSDFIKRNDTSEEMDELVEKAKECFINESSETEEDTEKN